MYAIIKTGGKQYKVAPNDVILVEKLACEKGSAIELDQVLLVGDEKSQTFGAPLVTGASVSATVLEQARGDKIIVFKKKRRKNYRRKAGHRQDLTALRIIDISVGGRKKAAAVKAEPKTEAKKAAPKKADAKPAEAKKAAPKKAEARKAPAKPAAAKKAPAKKAAPKKAAARKAPAKKPAAKKK